MCIWIISTSRGFSFRVENSSGKNNEELVEENVFFGYLLLLCFRWVYMEPEAHAIIFKLYWCGRIFSRLEERFLPFNPLLVSSQMKTFLSAVLVIFWLLRWNIFFISGFPPTLNQTEKLESKNRIYVCQSSFYSWLKVCGFWVVQTKPTLASSL